VLRLALALSALLAVPVAVRSVRAGRPRPGLQAQHVTGVRLVQALCGATVDGAALQSTALTFRPGPLAGGVVTADAQTAGAVALLLQARGPVMPYPIAHMGAVSCKGGCGGERPQVALPCVLYAPVPCTLVLRGGTNATMAPPIDYMQRVLLPVLARQCGVAVQLDLVRRGFFPKGGGEVRVTVSPRTAPLPALRLEAKGTPVAIHTLVYTAGALPPAVGARIAAAAHVRPTTAHSACSGSLVG
jgi:RNA 3'-terminal phosphate cyclase (ATP)